MIDVKQIPDEVVEAARAAYREGFENLDSHEKIMRASIAAALSAWPEVKRVKGYFTHDTDHYEPAIILPLPQEASDE